MTGAWRELSLGREGEDVGSRPGAWWTVGKARAGEGDCQKGCPAPGLPHGGARRDMAPWLYLGKSAPESVASSFSIYAVNLGWPTLSLSAISRPLFMSPSPRFPPSTPLPLPRLPPRPARMPPTTIEAVRFNSAFDCQMTSSAVVSLPTLLTRSARPITPQNQLELLGSHA